MASQAGDEPEDLKLQKTNWELIEAHIDRISGDITKTDIQTIFEELLKVNILLGYPILVDTIIKAQIKTGSSMSLAWIASIINSEIPSFGEKLAIITVEEFLRNYSSRNARVAVPLSELISYLFIYDLLGKNVILQILNKLLADIRNENNVNILMHLLGTCGKYLMIKDKIEYNKVFETLRQDIQNRKVSESVMGSLSLLFDQRKDGYSNFPKPHALPANLNKQLPHDFSITDLSNHETNLRSFKYCETFKKVEQDFTPIKENILSLIVPIEKEDTKSNNLNLAIDDMTKQQEIDFKKKIYLILKSSLSGDEAAHKLLKLRIAANQKWRVVDIIVNSSLQESTYSKFYGIISERLCNYNKEWGLAFGIMFEKNYETIDDFEPTKLRILGKFWGHILSTDYVGFEVFKCIHINEEETTAASRIFIKFLFQELVIELGIDELNKRLNEEYISPFIKGMFPIDDPDNMKYSINYFTAIGLGKLTDNMREVLDIIKKEEIIKAELDNDSDEETYPGKEESDEEEFQSNPPNIKEQSRYSEIKQEEDHSIPSIEKTNRNPHMNEQRRQMIDNNSSQSRYNSVKFRYNNNDSRSGRNPSKNNGKRARSRTPPRERFGKRRGRFSGGHTKSRYEGNK